MTPQMIGALLNQLNTQRPQKIELAPGQIVKGKILKLFPQNTAWVQLGGIQITTHLQAALKVGQTAWLQVQSSSHPVALKVLSERDHIKAAQLPRPTPEGLVKLLQLPDNKGTIQLIRNMISEQIPLTKENIFRLQKISKLPQLPRHWLSIAALLLDRNIPVNTDTFQSVVRFFGKSDLSVLVGQWVQEAGKYLGNQADNRLGNIANNQQNYQASNKAGYLASSQTGNKAGGYTSSQASNLVSYQDDSQASGKAGEAVRNLQKSNMERSLSQMEKQGTVRPILSTKPVNSQQEVNLPLNPQKGVVHVPPSSQWIQSNRAAQSSNEAASIQTGETVNPSMVQTNIERLLRQIEALPKMSSEDLSGAEVKERLSQHFELLGLNHEKKWWDLLKSRFLKNPHTNDLGLVDDQRSVNMKASLMNLLSDSSLSKGLRDASQQLLQHITGQQLMFHDSSSQLSQVLFQIPLQWENESKTGFIQIEAREKEKGTMDPDNCHLVFLLEMDRLGQTMVDVNIVNKIMGIHIFTDKKGEKVLSQLKEELSEKLTELGYHLSNFQISEFISEEQKQSFGTIPPSRSFQKVDLRV